MPFEEVFSYNVLVTSLEATLHENKATPLLGARQEEATRQPFLTGTTPPTTTTTIFEFVPSTITQPTPSFEYTTILEPNSTASASCSSLPALQPLHQQAEPPRPSAPGNITHCPLFELIFARGTGEPPGLGGVGISLLENLYRTIPSTWEYEPHQAITAYGVDYTAPRFMVARALRRGAIDILKRVDTWMTHDGCADTRLVLGGYSLGAGMMQYVKLFEAEQERVIAVVSFGYPFLLRPRDEYEVFPVPSEKLWAKCIPEDPVCDRERYLASVSNKIYQNNQAVHSLADTSQESSSSIYTPGAKSFQTIYYQTKVRRADSHIHPLTLHRPNTPFVKAKGRTGQISMCQTVIKVFHLLTCNCYQRRRPRQNQDQVAQNNPLHAPGLQFPPPRPVPPPPRRRRSGMNPGGGSIPLRAFVNVPVTHNLPLAAELSSSRPIPGPVLSSDGSQVSMSDVQESFAVGGAKGVDEGSWMRGGGGGSVEQVSLENDVGERSSSAIPSLPPLIQIPSFGSTFLHLDPIQGMDFMMWEREQISSPTAERLFSFDSRPDVLSIGSKLPMRLDSDEDGKGYEIVRCPDNPSAVHRYVVTNIDPAEPQIMPKPSLQTGAEGWREAKGIIPKADGGNVYDMELGEEKAYLQSQPIESNAKSTLPAQSELDHRKIVQVLALALDNIANVASENPTCVEGLAHEDAEDERHGTPQFPSALKTLKKTRALRDLHLDSGSTSSETQGDSKTSSSVVEAASEGEYTKSIPASPPPNTPIDGICNREDIMPFTKLWMEGMRSARARGHATFEREDDETTCVSDA
ncbi:cutinase-domain-containing protein [Peziza echinospora]|nr:cutinase-domain-containing protein [Peziza echinospora]